jgi:hypothetical protein
MPPPQLAKEDDESLKNEFWVGVGATDGDVELENNDMMSAFAVCDRFPVGVGALKSRSKRLLPVGASVGAGGAAPVVGCGAWT